MLKLVTSLTTRVLELSTTMTQKLRLSGLMLAGMLLGGCVTVEAEPPVVINGAAGYLERVALPPDSAITIAIIDMDTPGAVIAQKTFNVVTMPVPFKFILPRETVDPKANYGVVALIKHNNQVIFQTYDRYPVVSNNKFTTEVLMKPARP